MPKIKICKQFTFEMAHVLHKHDGLCANLHGHSYKLWICVEGEPLKNDQNPKNGMVMDFFDLKNIVNKHIIDIFDHSVVLPSQSSKELIANLQKSDFKVIVVDFQPTSELLLLDFVQKLKPNLPDNVTLKSMQLWETANSYAQWDA